MAPPTRRRAGRAGQNQPVEHDENETMRDRFEGDFFRFSSVSWYALIIAGITLFWIVAYHPDLIPYHLLGPIGNLLITLKDNHRKSLLIGFKVMVLIHSVEAFAVYRLCRQMKFTMKTTLKWTVQTVLVGFASLGILLKYSNERHKFNKENKEN